MHVLITAGPTREHLDAVRYLSNASSGRMGFECARAARKAGHRVTLVTGPVALADPAGVRVVRVTSAAEMRREVLKVYPKVQAVIMTAAVADYRPARRAAGKPSKGAAALTLRLVPTPDILRELGARKGGRVLVGFALEASRGRARALEKYRRKNLDLVVLNPPASMEADLTNADFYREGRLLERFRRAPKRAVAAALVRLLPRLQNQPG